MGSVQSHLPPRSSYVQHAHQARDRRRGRRRRGRGRHRGERGDLRVVLVLVIDPTTAQSGGRHSVNGKTEAALTGETAAKVQAAALAKVPGTVERVETNVDSSAPYEAHITKADGTQVEVQVNSDYTVAAVNTMGAHP